MSCYQKMADRHRQALGGGLPRLLGTHPVLQDGVPGLGRAAHPLTGIGDRSGGKEIAEKPAFENRVGLLLVGGGLEFWHGNPCCTDGDPDMFPEIIHMGQETRRDPALLTWRHRLREPAGRQPD